MSNLKFAETHNLVVFLEKPEESDGFEGIIDFLNASSIRYALTVNPTIYTSCIKQFWATKQSRRKQRKDTKVSQPSDPTEPMADETENAEHVPTHSNDPLFSGDDRLQLNELMELCTKLSERVLDLENTNTSQAEEITKLKERVNKLEKRNKSRTPRLKMLRMGRNADNLMFDTGVFYDQEVKVEKIVSNAEVTIAKEKLAKQREEDANIVEWDNVQAMIDANYELAARLQAQEQEELTVKEKSKLFVELIDKRKKHFARLRVEERRRKPPTKAQKRNQMCTYLKNMAGFTHSQLKNKSFDEVQKAFNKTICWIDSFVSMDFEVVK
ncbi:hypothetical protein Tco_0843081 [Tanacetum coccineum]|uniref:Uncharacterized protein n=1 Tax=Tanacetum coccineum TaxID=301880 RepID=A0ABQ5B6T2_9ASTR